jgi:type I restriction enzyme R subunit
LGVGTSEINERVSAKLEELEIDDIDVQQRLEKELRRDYHIITAEKRLDQIARDFVEHYSTEWETGKAMLVCIDKITCVRMYDLIRKYWSARMLALSRQNREGSDEQEEIYTRRQIQWMEATRMAVVVSEEQGEVDKFRKWNLDITPHRRLMKEGFALEDGKRIDVDEAFKKDEHPFRIAIVCAMWLTGFDVPGLATLYLDKPLKAHTLMQAIARANRVSAGKNNGLIVDYCGILKNLRKALATFTGSGGADGDGGLDPARPAPELLAELDEAIALVRAFLGERGFRLEDINDKTGFARNAAIVAAKEAVNESDETRKRYEIMAREVFKKFKACLTVDGISAYRQPCDAVNIIYKSLQKDRDAADISDIVRALHGIVDEAISTECGSTAKEPARFDISKIDFERLRREFERSPSKHSTVQALKQVVETRLSRMMARNPLRADLQRHYEEIVADYNSEKDRVTIENTFAALLKFVQSLDDEETRALREGLDEESLALFDLLLKPGLDKADVQRIKKVSADLLTTLKGEKLKIENWRDKEATRDAVQVTIHDFLWAETTGLPAPAYTEDEVEAKTRDVYRHVHRVYPTLPSPFYLAH